MQTLYLVRHGSRLDLTDPAWLKTAARPFDPPLSPDGVLQAQDVGRQLADADICHIFASPFIRCVETAYYIAKKVGLPIKLETGLSELLVETWFPYPPDFLSAHEFSARFPCIDLSYEPLVTPVYPETKETGLNRVWCLMQELIARYSGNILLVGHGGSLWGIARALVEGHLEMHAPYCCLVKLVRNNGKWIVEADGCDTSHLQRATHDEMPSL